MAGTIINALDIMLSTPVGLIYLFSLSDEWRYSKRTIKISVCIYMLIVCVLNICIFISNGVQFGAAAIVPQVNAITCLIYYFIIYKYRDGRFVFIYSSFCNFIFISDTLSDILVQTPGLTHLMVKILVFLLIGVVVFVFFRPPFLDALKGIKSEWQFLMMVPLTLSFLFAFLIMIPGPLFMNPQFQMPALILCVAVVCIYAAFFSLFSNLRKQYQIEENNHLLQTQVAALVKQAEVVQSMSEQVYLFRHDMRHYIQMQEDCLESGDIESAKQIIHHLDEKIENAFTKHQLKPYTGLIAIDSVLSFSEEKAKSNGIDITIRMAAPPENTFQITEFAVVLSNAIENALKACINVRDTSKRTLCVVGGRMLNQYLLEIVNSYEGTVEFHEDGTPVTHEEGHGYGTRSIKDFVSRYHGRTEFTATDGMFTFRMLVAVGDTSSGEGMVP